jgi:hypothetical protein
MSYLQFLKEIKENNRNLFDFRYFRILFFSEIFLFNESVFIITAYHSHLFNRSKQILVLNHIEEFKRLYFNRGKLLL